MNDDLLKQTAGGNYFEELLARIRCIRSSEKVFLRKVLDVYATSIDYDAKLEISILFLQTVQINYSGLYKAYSSRNNRSTLLCC